MLEEPDLSLHSRVAVQLRLAEKQILETASASGRAKRLHLEQQLADGAPLPRCEESADAKVEEEHRHLLNGEEDVYGVEMEVRKDALSTLDSIGGSTHRGQRGGASRTEDDPKEKRE